jgi:phytol kinase
MIIESPYIISHLCTTGLLAAIAWTGGVLVRRRAALVSYTRKVNHFAMYLVPQLLDLARTDVSVIINALGVLPIFVLFWTPIRTRLPFARTMFASFDRPGDRPHTLKWMISQFCAGAAVFLFMIAYFYHLGFASLTTMVLMVATVGDGLAEPIGVRYGKRTYAVRGFLVNRPYTRSYVGSLCVFVCSAVIVALFYDSFTVPQLISALMCVPVAMTLAEAVAPHTWDTPFLILAGGVCVAAIKQVVP